MQKRTIVRLFHVPAPETGRASAIAARFLLAMTNAKRP
jgi:hypothetical protein